jgi:hypothetical protein
VELAGRPLLPGGGGRCLLAVGEHICIKKGLVHFRQLIEVYRGFAAPLICFDGGSLRGTAFSGTVDRSSYDGNG